MWWYEITQDYGLNDIKVEIKLSNILKIFYICILTQKW